MTFSLCLMLETNEVIVPGSSLMVKNVHNSAQCSDIAEY